MSMAPSHEVTALLHAWSDGDPDALARIVELVYPELRNIARRCLNGERNAYSLQATALVHEAYLRLIDIQQVRWQDRAHFFAIGARIMRRILVDHARARDCAKRGAGMRPTLFNEALTISSEIDPVIVKLDETLDRLAELDSRKAQVVEMRYFGGLTADEIASVLTISPQSVRRDWNLAKAWLVREMSSGKTNEPSTLGRG